MKTALLSIAFVTIIAGFIVNFRNEAVSEWQSFENEFEVATIEKEQPKVAIEKDTHTEPAVDQIKSESLIKTEEVQAAEQAYIPTEKDPLNHLSSKLKESPFFEDVINFQLDELSLVEKNENRAELLSYLQSLSSEILSCLRDKTCQETLGEKYQNHSETRSHQLMERVLYLAQVFHDEGESVLNFDQSLDLLELENPQIQVIGIELIAGSMLQEAQFVAVLEKSALLTGQARGHLFSELERFTRDEPQLRESYLNQMATELQRDSDGAIEILKHLQFVTLDQKEFAQIGKELCVHRESKSAEEWQMIQFHIERYSELKGVNLPLHQVCTAKTN